MAEWKRTTEESGTGKLRQCVCACAIYSVRSLLLLPFFALADPHSEPTAGVSGNIQTAILSPAFLKANEASIGVITINNGSIFDLKNPDENNWLYKLANRTHVITRPDVIQQQLLFNTDDKYSPRVLEESERLLRSNRYIQEATITPLRFENGVVDIDVRTTDTWTLVPKLDFSRKGGENNTALGFKELNLFGSGMQVELAYESDVYRDSTIVKIIDRNLGSSWYSLAVVYGDNSDGHTRILTLARPFFSLDTNLSGGLSYLDSDQLDSLYDQGELYSAYRHRAKSYELFGGWSNGLATGWTRRYTTGLAYDEHEFAPVEENVAAISITPENRKFVYPFVGIELMQDRYEKGQNYDQIQRTEDRYLGTRISARLGYANSAFGSDRNAWLINAEAQTTFVTSKQSNLFLSGDISVRREKGALHNLVIHAGAKYYKRQSGGRLFYASLDASYGRNLDVDNQLLLGGDNGLRGYPLQFLSGDKRALVTLEQRFFTDWYPFRLFRVGAAVFFDAGRTWGTSLAGSENPGMQKDIGLGLRLGNSRSGQGHVIHVDLAFPLDGDGGMDDVQFLIETKKSF